ncbi:MAG: response regulator transcription factor [Candidatus Nomurabacteria bacterium]|jgi:DNA-binding response OmpR family regulator|nr:response regulator transcription factor [Candidatus Nomurabacteria bacterium]
MNILIASDNLEIVGEISKVFEAAGYNVDKITAKELDLAKQENYDLVLIDPELPVKILKSGNIELDIKAHAVRRNKKLLKITPLEFKIIQFFIENNGKIITKDELIAGCWRAESKVSYNTIDVYVKKLRAKLGVSLIRTIHGVGYQMEKK